MTFRAHQILVAMVAASVVGTAVAWAQTMISEPKNSEQLGPYVVYFGPIGVAFGILAGVLMFFYRKDILQRLHKSEERETEYVKMMVTAARVLESVSEALDQQAKTNEKVEQAITAFIRNMPNWRQRE